MKSLVIAEKPSVARDIARVLHCGKKQDGVLEGGAYVVTWALGHLVTLADPEAYDAKYKEWRLEELPMIPEPFKLDIIGQTAKQYKTVKNQLYRKDIGEIIIATDAGREGELVARLILVKAGSQKPTKRLWISSVTDKAIKEGFQNLKDGAAYNNLYDAAMCRAEADWLVGINATRALTCKYNAQLSCGRVQTPTLAMIAGREQEIREFVPESYYGMTAKTAEVPVVFTWKDQKSGSHRSFNKTRIEELLRTIGNKGKGQIAAVRRIPKKTFAPGLYDLTELQREANRRFQYSAKDTLNIMQRLYENHKVLTYPRTDSRYLSTDIVPSLKERLDACGVGPYKKWAGMLKTRKIEAKPSFVDDKKVSDHHAIIPTEQFVQLDHMTIDERRIYDLVVRRFLAVLLPAFEYEQTELELDLSGERFVAKGKIVKNLGWKAVYENLDEEEEEQELKEQKLPDLKQGTSLSGITVSMTEGKTKPPALFNEATLLSAMENPAAYMQSKNKTLAKVLGETGGLGTVATRADIIEKLFSSFLLEKRGKDIVVTSKARQLLSLVPEELKQPELTANWEIKLSQIASGQIKRAAFMEDIRIYSKRLTEEIKTGSGQFRHDNLTNTKCPACGKRMLAVKGKNSEMLVCQDRDCGHRETVARTSNARCPVCHKKMQLRGSGEGQLFLCKCGYKEKLSAFKSRREKEGAGISKKDVSRYMDQQKKKEQEPINSALAEALAKIKLD